MIPLVRAVDSQPHMAYQSTRILPDSISSAPFTDTAPTTKATQIASKFLWWERLQVALWGLSTTETKRTAKASESIQSIDLFPLHNHGILYVNIHYEFIKKIFTKRFSFQNKMIFRYFDIHNSRRPFLLSFLLFSDFLIVTVDRMEWKKM